MKTMRFSFEETIKQTQEKAYLIKDRYYAILELGFDKDNIHYMEGWTFPKNKINNTAYLKSRVRRILEETK